MTKERNNIVDAIRGVAILLVVLGHTMTGLLNGAENTVVYNIIWSLQMPLFFLISGYVARYSKRIDCFKSLLVLLKRRTISYLLPWFAWTVIRIVAFGQSRLSDIKYLAFNMDIGYWFLFSIWTIAIIFGVSQYLSSKIIKNENKFWGVIITLGFYAIGAVCLLVLGYFVGFSFLSIKLTLYYMLFYAAGYIYGKFQDEIYNIKCARVMQEVFVAICMLVFIYLVVNFNTTNSNGIIDYMIRAIASGTGSVAICGLAAKLFTTAKKAELFFTWFGKHSMEIYLAHCIPLIYATKINKVCFDSIEGVLTIAIMYVITVVITSLLVSLLNQNKVLNFVLFAKK